MPCGRSRGGSGVPRLTRSSRQFGRKKIFSRGLRELRGWACSTLYSGRMEILRAHPRNSRNPRQNTSKQFHFRIILPSAISR